MYWKAEYIILIVLSTVLDYTAAIRIHDSNKASTRKIWMAISLAGNLGLLGFFKYYNFFNTSFGRHFPLSELLLPAGISFYTFQTLSYTLDVYRRDMQPERHFGRFALFVSFFPQLVAGPIERAGNLVPQLRVLDDIQYADLRAGLQRIVIGLFKKVVIADRLAIVANTVYTDPHRFSGPQLTLATLFFGIQIYCDFSGYSDIAIGTARIFGIRLMENFNRPYNARCISEFWSRWHISLSTWFRDYVYIPLGGNRTAPPRVVFNLLVTFLISGLWHGANWTFVIWGAYHGSLLVVERWFTPALNKWEDRWGWTAKFLRWAATFLLVMAGWAIFRANNLSDAIAIFTNLTTGWSTFDPIRDLSGLGLTKTFMAWSLFVILALGGTHILEHRIYRVDWLERHLIARWTFYMALLLVIVIMGVNGSESQFIYFQF